MNPAVPVTTRRKTMLSLAIAGTLALAGAQIAVLAQTRTPIGQTAPAYIRQNPEEVAKRVHMALFQRDSDGSLNDTIAEVRAGRLRARTDALVATPEFKTIRNRQNVNQMLDQIVQGMLRRGATADEQRRYNAALKQGVISSIVLDLAASSEFQSSLPNNPTSPGGTPTSAVDAGRAADCQEQVVEQMRDNTQGIVFLRFESAESDGGAVRGVAFDVIDNNRRLTYRCDGGASYSYDDGRNTRSAPNEGDFPSERVRACQNNVRSRVQSQRSGIEVTFESAGLMSSGDKVRGLGFEKKPQGQNFHYRCDLNGSTVTNASVTWR